jgi:hypothetical protein
MNICCMLVKVEEFDLGKSATILKGSMCKVVAVSEYLFEVFLLDHHAV